MNLSGTFNAFRLLLQPKLCIPHAAFSTFDEIPIPVSKALMQANGGKEPNIKVVILDKDNCFAKPRENVIHTPYRSHFESLRQCYPGKHLLIVSNSAGTDSDPSGHEAKLLSDATGVDVFRHSTKKPGCGQSVLDYLQRNEKLGVNHPSQVAVIGDRLFTDIMMANMMGAWGIWVTDGVIKNNGPVSPDCIQRSLEVMLRKQFSRLERSLPPLAYRFGMNASVPQEQPW